jgi:D-serine deaminase-like pyridoxal phosphate-dependent protein
MRPGIRSSGWLDPDRMNLPPTPFLAVDDDVMDRNLKRMADSASHRELALRPHAKTHKIPEIAQLQLKYGAAGLTVATIGEAEVFAAGGVNDLFIAYPLWLTEEKANRLHALAERASLRVGVDSVESAEQLGKFLGRAGTGAGAGVEVMVEVDSGHHRSGTQPDDAGAVAGAAARAGLVVSGVFTFPGHGFGPGRAGAAAADEARALSAAVSFMTRGGHAPAVISGGSTPTAAHADAGMVNEVRPGVYVFNDAQQAELGTCAWDDVALAAVATVVSRSGRNVILDAGSKVLGADQAAWASGGGRLPDRPDARVVALSEHHATVAFPEGEQLPELGELLRVAPNHVCAAINLADEVVVMRAGGVIDSWRVAARGKNS